MRPADAARQLEYAVASKRDSYDYELGHWAHTYEDVFADVIERGELADVMAVVERLGEEFDGEGHPSPTRAQTVADSVLTAGGRPLTDGGDA
jgi:hypothetical protein